MPVNNKLSDEMITFYLSDHIISLRGEAWAQNTSLTGRRTSRPVDFSAYDISAMDVSSYIQFNSATFLKRKSLFQVRKVSGLVFVLESIGFVTFYDLSWIWNIIWKCSDTVVLFVFHFIYTLSTHLTGDIFNIFQTTFVSYIIPEWNLGLL